MAEYSIGEYTQNMFDEIWSFPDYDYEQDYSEVFKKIDDPAFFKQFSERLLSFYNEILKSDSSADEAKTDLQHRVSKAGISLISRNTISNWFSGKAPDYGDDDRKRMFAIAFALELSREKTERLFHTVFLDKAFNKRNVNEFIYLHCICNKKPFAVAEHLINELPNLVEHRNPTDQTKQTQYLADAASRKMSEHDILEFISTHQYNFSLSNTAAKQHQQKLLDRSTIGIEGTPGLARQEYERRRFELSDSEDTGGFSGKNNTSIDFLLYMIFNINFVQEKNTDIISIRKIFSRKEIYNQFPNKNTLSNSKSSSYILRKNIILLSFYNYWVNDFLERKKEGDIDGFTAGLNDVLFECGFSPLYAGNPYDWLFLYCSACTTEDFTPLDRFRGIIGQDQSIAN